MNTSVQVQSLAQTLGASSSGTADYVRRHPDLSYVQPGDPWLTRRIISGLEHLWGRQRAQTIYDELKMQAFDANTFFHQALQQIGVNVVLTGTSVNELPRTGPLVFVANHPYGVLDGMIMCDLAMRCRGNFRILIHAMLCQDQDLIDYFLPIDFQAGKAATRNNIRSKQLAMAALEKEIPLVIFPSGMVSTADRLGFGRVKDAPWTTFAAKLICQTQATVVPVYFHGQNSRKFHLASHVAEPLRMALLIHEALNKHGHAIKVAIGDPLSWAEISQHAGRQRMTDFLYQSVQNLAH
jgi:putative hemolysin